MENEELKNKMIEKIAKLLNHAEGAKAIGSLAEAESALNKANQLLVEYNLSLFDINGKREEKKEIKMSSIRVPFGDNQSGSRWKRMLIHVLAEYNFCTLVGHTGTKEMSILGEVHNVDTLVYLYNNLSIQLLRLAQESYTSLFSRPSRYGYLKDFLLGAIDGFESKLKKQRREQEKQANMTALVLFNKEAVEKFKGVLFPDLTAGRKMKTVYINNNTYQKGFDVGYGINAQGGIKTTESKAPLKLT